MPPALLAPQVFNDAGVPAQTISVPQRPIYWPTFFSDQASDVTPELSEKTVEALLKVGAAPAGFCCCCPLCLWGLSGGQPHRRSTTCPNTHALLPTRRAALRLLPNFPTAKQIGVIDQNGTVLDDPRKGFPGLDWRVGGFLLRWLGLPAGHCSRAQPTGSRRPRRRRAAAAAQPPPHSVSVLPPTARPQGQLRQLVPEFDESGATVTSLELDGSVVFGAPLLLSRLDQSC